jgi:predicted Zn-dependent peptidase
VTEAGKDARVAAEPQISQLNNGLRVVTTPVPTAQSVSVNLFVGVGSRGETPRTNGVSHYMEHLLFKGTTRRPDATLIAETIEGAGGVLNAYTSKELTCYWNQVPYDRLATGMDVLADMFRDSLLTEIEIERERTVVQQEIRRAHDQPGAWASELLSRATFGDQPIGWPIAGTLETVEGMQRDDFAEHVKTYYTPSNSVLSVAGNTTHDEVTRLAEQHYGDMPDTPAPAPPPASARFPDERVIVEKREIAQCNIGIAMYGIARLDPDRYPLQIMNTILGRGMSSRLFREVREKRGLAYSVGSGASRYTDIGTMSVSAGVTLDHLEEATQVIRDELFKLRDEPVADDELVKARDFSTGNFRLGLESTMALAQRAGESLLMTREIEPVEDVVESLRRVTAGDVQRVAQRLFRPGGFSMAVVGPGGEPDALRAILDAA